MNEHPSTTPQQHRKSHRQIEKRLCSAAISNGAVQRQQDTKRQHVCFAYGSNMIVAQMDFRCLGAQLLGQASLPNHAFQINSRGVATVVPSMGSTVYGVLWNISAKDEQQLDIYEGVAGQFYRKTHVDVQKQDGSRVRALIYLATNQQPGSPRRGYLESIIAAAIQHGLPPLYVESLEQWLP